MTFRAEFEHRDALIGAALDEFSEHGYDAVSLNRILSAAGMSKGQMYHHFANKEALYLALVEWTIDEEIRWHTGGHAVRVPDDFFDAIEANITAGIPARVVTSRYEPSGGSSSPPSCPPSVPCRGLRRLPPPQHIARSRRPW